MMNKLFTSSWFEIWNFAEYNVILLCWQQRDKEEKAPSYLLVELIHLISFTKTLIEAVNHLIDIDDNTKVIIGDFASAAIIKINLK